MIKSVANAIAAAARELVRNRRILLLLVALYAALIVALYLFVATREASIWQIVLTFVFAVFAFVAFFVLQAMAANYVGQAASQQSHSASTLVRQGVRSSWKLMVVSVVPMLIAGVILFGLNKIEQRIVTSNLDAPAESSIVNPNAAESESQRVRWPAAMLTALRLLIFGLILPLITIHLWIGAARNSLSTALRQTPRLLGDALAPGAVLVYLVGLIVFAVLPYLILSTRTSIKYAWLDLTLLGVRLILALLCIFFSWVVTIGALTRLTLPSAPSPLLVEEHTATQDNPVEA